MSANLEYSAVAQDWKRSAFILIPKKDSAKKCSNYHTIVLISRTSKVMLKFLQARLQHYINHMYKLGFKEAEEVEIKLPTVVGSWKKQGNSKKKSTSTSLTMLQSLTVWITTNWKILKEIGIPYHCTCLLRNYMQVKNQQLESDREQWTGSKLGKEYVKAVYCHPTYLIFVQSTSHEILG